MTIDENQAGVEEPIEAVDAPEVEPVEVETETAEVKAPVEKDWDDDTEEDARYLGWKSPDEWKGDVPPGYIGNPKEYMDRLERSTPFRKMRERAEQAEAKLQEKLDRITSAVDAGHKRELERQRSEYERQMRVIAAGQRKAVEEADTERFDQLEQHKQSLRPPEDPVATPDHPEDPVEPFKADHAWLNDPIMRQTGATLIDQAVSSGALPPTANAKAQIEYAEEQVKKYYPHLFKADEPDPKPKPAAKVDGGGLAAPRSRSGFDSLPKEARSEFSRQVSKGVFEDTKEDREFFYNEYQNA